MLVRASYTFIVLLVLVIISSLILYSGNVAEQVADGFISPSWSHLFGTDSLGRDLFQRVINGARISLIIGLLSAVLSLCFGTLYGSLAAWWGGRRDWAMMKFVDILFCIPTLVLLILLSVGMDSLDLGWDPWWQSVLLMSFSLFAVSWMGIARVVRGAVLKVKAEPFIEAAKAMGVPEWKQILFHIMPNIKGTLLVLLTFQIPYNILFESFMSFIGLGLQPPYSSWGVLINDGWKVLRYYPHVIFFPALALFLTSLSLNTIGDSLRARGGR